MNVVIHFWLKPGKDRELESQKAGESQGTLSRKIGWKSWGSVTQFWRTLKGESLFSKSKLKNPKNLKVAGEGAGGSSDPHPLFGDYLV